MGQGHCGICGIGLFSTCYIRKLQYLLHSVHYTNTCYIRYYPCPQAAWLASIIQVIYIQSSANIHIILPHYRETSLHSSIPICYNVCFIQCLPLLYVTGLASFNAWHPYIIKGLKYMPYQNTSRLWSLYSCRYYLEQIARPFWTAIPLSIRKSIHEKSSFILRPSLTKHVETLKSVLCWFFICILTLLFRMP